MTRQQFRLVCSNVREPGFQYFGDASVERSSWVTQQGAVGGILHQSMFEQISYCGGIACRNSKPAFTRRSSED